MAGDDSRAEAGLSARRRGANRRRPCRLPAEGRFRRHGTTRIIEPIELYGDRAIVRCVVAVGDQHFDNLRLFVRREGSWKLLPWANEPSTIS